MTCSLPNAGSRTACPWPPALRRLHIAAAVVGLFFLPLYLTAFASEMAAPTNGSPLRVMTFNLRYASESGDEAWSLRRPVMAACLREAKPDVMGTQEGLYPQLKDLAQDLPDYEWLGLGREGGSRGEFMAVFYRRDRLEPLAFDHFWLSETPEVIGSLSWNAACRRMVTWVRFRDLKSGGEFYFWNTHLDHVSEQARQEAAKLIARRVEELRPPLPLLLVGDFNTPGGASPAHAALVGPDRFADTWTLTTNRFNATLNSFHGFKAPRQEGTRIDWILLRGGGRVLETGVVDCVRDERRPSDHFPVSAVVELPVVR